MKNGFAVCMNDIFVTFIWFFWSARGKPAFVVSEKIFRRSCWQRENQIILNNELWAERSISRPCPIIFQLRHWILINLQARTASINLTPYRATNRGRSDILLDSRRLLQRLDEMLKLKGKKNYENRAIGHDISERHESLFSFDRNNIGHFRSVLDLGVTARCLCTTRKYITTRRRENLSGDVCPYFQFLFKKFNT